MFKLVWPFLKLGMSLLSLWISKDAELNAKKAQVLKEAVDALKDNDISRINA